MAGPQPFSYMGALYILGFLFLRALAGPIAEEMVIHERVDHISPEFVDLGPPAASTVLNLRINLASSDLPGLEETLKEISDPSSLFYGNWLSKEQVSIRSISYLENKINHFSGRRPCPSLAEYQHTRHRMACATRCGKRE